MAFRDWFRRGKPVPADRVLAATFRRALLAVLEGDYDAAEELIASAVKADSEDVEPYRALARLYRLRGEIGRAIRIHQNLLLRGDIRPAERNAVLSDLACDFRQGGFSKRAIASYQEVLEYAPKDTDAVRALRDLLSETGDHAAALAAERRLAKLTGQREPASEARFQVRIAELDHAEGRHDAARKGAKRALRRDGKNADARMLLGELEAERGRNKQALAAWRVVPEQGGPRAAEAHARVEAAFAALGRARDYESFLRAILEERPDDEDARLALARTLAGRGEIDPAVLELRRVVDTNPESLDARIALGRLLLESGRDPEAAKAHAELLGWLAAREGSTDDAGNASTEPSE